MTDALNDLRGKPVRDQGTAANTRLWQLLTQPGGHKNAALDADALNRFATWMDTYTQRAGHFSVEQEKQLAEFRARLAGMVADE